MVEEVKDYPLLEVQGVGASGGVALTNTAQLIVLPHGINQLSLTPWNMAGGATVARFKLNPYLAVVKTADGGNTAASYTVAANDADAATDVVLSALPTLANGGALYIGAHQPFRGVTIDVDTANAVVNALAVTYWNGAAWSNITPTDSTAGGGASLAVDGNVTWTVPTDWARASLRPGPLVVPTDIQPNIGVLRPIVNDLGPGDAGQRLFWTRWVWSVALSATVTLNSIYALNRSTAYAELLSGVNANFPVEKRIGGISVVEALTNAGTANLVVAAWAQVNQDAGLRGFV